MIDGLNGLGHYAVIGSHHQNGNNRYLGATGMATGTHCHVEVFIDGQNVDPADYLLG